MKNRIAASLLMFCFAVAASAQNAVGQPEQTKQSRKSRSKARNHADQQSAQAHQPQMAEETQTASALIGCDTANAAGQTSEAVQVQTKKPEGDFTASQNVVEYGGGGF